MNVNNTKLQNSKKLGNITNLYPSRDKINFFLSYSVIVFCVLLLLKMCRASVVALYYFSTLREATGGSRHNSKRGNSLSLEKAAAARAAAVSKQTTEPNILTICDPLPRCIFVWFLELDSTCCHVHGCVVSGTKPERTVLNMTEAIPEYNNFEN